MRLMATAALIVALAAPGGFLFGQASPDVADLLRRGTALNNEGKLDSALRSGAELHRPEGANGMGNIDGA